VLLEALVINSLNANYKSVKLRALDPAPKFMAKEKQHLFTNTELCKSEKVMF